ncbi:MAG: hypothetical protein R3Y24_01805 [Eubacteriales bacterium]
MKRIIGMLVTFILSMQLLACGSEEVIIESCIQINKDGSITATLIESFEETYYDFDELCQMNESEVAAFNRTNGEDSILIDEAVFENGQVTLTMTYDSSDTYSAYNEVELFVGTIAEAYHASYDLEVTLYNTAGDEEIGRNEILEMSSKNIVIIEEMYPVYTTGNILYHSQDASVGSNKKFATISSEEITYIVFK